MALRICRSFFVKRGISASVFSSKVWFLKGFKRVDQKGQWPAAYRICCWSRLRRNEYNMLYSPLSHSGLLKLYKRLLVEIVALIKIAFIHTTVKMCNK